MFSRSCLTYECDANPNLECLPNFCGGCYADFYDLNGNLAECTSTTEECFDFTDIDFGACAMVLGVGLLNDECSYISGCDWTVNGIDYSGLFFDSIEECEDNCSDDNLINLGDLNDDGEINVIDVVLLVSNILDDTVTENGDINQDNLLNVLDVVLLVDIILNQDNIPEAGLFISQQYQEAELTFFYDLVYSERSNINGLQYSSGQNQVQDQLQDTILLELDIALPPNPENKPLPLVVVIHGGGFSGGSKKLNGKRLKIMLLLDI